MSSRKEATSTGSCALGASSAAKLLQDIFLILTLTNILFHVLLGIGKSGSIVITSAKGHCHFV